LELYLVYFLKIRDKFGNPEVSKLNRFKLSSGDSKSWLNRARWYSHDC